MNESSFPNSNESRYSHLSVVAPYVITHKLRLIITDVKIDKLTACYDNVTTGHTSLAGDVPSPCYEKHKDCP